MVKAKNFFNFKLVLFFKKGKSQQPVAQSIESSF